MRHLKSGRKLGRTNSHKKALMRNLAMSLFEFKRVSTTLAKAKELRPYAEDLITKAKKAYLREQAGQLPENHTIDIHSRRLVARYIQKKAVLQELFDTIGPKVIDRNGGYTRIIKTGTRRGDAAETAIIELVDWANPQDGATSIKPKKKAAKKSKVKVAIPTPVKAEEKVEEKIEEKTEEPVVAEVEETVVNTNETPEVSDSTTEPTNNSETAETNDSSKDKPEA